MASEEGHSPRVCGSGKAVDNFTRPTWDVRSSGLQRDSGLAHTRAATCGQAGLSMAPPNKMDELFEDLPNFRERMRTLEDAVKMREGRRTVSRTIEGLCRC